MSIEERGKYYKRVAELGDYAKSMMNELRVWMSGWEESIDNSNASPDELESLNRKLQELTFSIDGSLDG